MRIIFKDDRQQRLFESASRLNAEFGGLLAKKIKQRLSEVDAASCLEDLRHAPGKWHELKGDRKGQLACSLTGNFRIVFLPAFPPGSVNATGLDWKAVTGLAVLEVIDYH